MNTTEKRKLTACIVVLSYIVIGGWFHWPWETTRSVIGGGMLLGLLFALSRGPLDSTLKCDICLWRVKHSFGLLYSCLFLGRLLR